MNTQEKESNYTLYNELEAQGGRVGLCVCKICGCAILLEKETDSMRIHDLWHEIPRKSK